MKRKPYSQRKRTTTKSVLRLPELEHAKTAVLNRLTSPDAQRGYRHAIDEFVDWYCSEPRLALNRTVVLRYRSHLESRQLAPGTINLRLGAVRRLAYEAADCGLLSADLAAGIRRVIVRGLFDRIVGISIRRKTRQFTLVRHAFVFLKGGNRLWLTLFKDLKIFLLQPGNRFARAIGHHHVHNRNIYLGFENCVR